MHEVGIAAEVMRLALAHSGGARVRRVVVEVGCLAAVLPDALVFAFELLREGTPLDGATLDVVRVPARARCGSCGTVIERDGPFAWCDCGSSELSWLSGDELGVRWIDVSDAEIERRGPG